MTKSKLIKFVKNNTLDILSYEFNISAISIGGSRAQGYSLKNSDIDLLIFVRNKKKYYKKFCNINDIPIELHIIPVELPDFYYLIFKKLFKGKVNTIYDFNKEILGTKQCFKIASVDYSNLTQVLFAWREFYKIWNSVPIWQKDDWFDNFHLRFSKMAPNSLQIKKEMRAVKTEDVTEAIVKLVKLENVLNKKAFSKILWFEEYLRMKDDKELLSLIKKIFGEITKIPISWVRYISNLKDKVNTEITNSNLDCDLCKGVSSDCNIGRSINDFYNDYNKAIQKNWNISALLCLKKVESLLKSRSNLIKDYIYPTCNEWEKYWIEINRNKRIEYNQLLNYYLKN